jgi:hypothetical protein
VLARALDRIVIRKSNDKDHQGCKSYDDLVYRLTIVNIGSLHIHKTMDWLPDDTGAL